MDLTSSKSDPNNKFLGNFIGKPISTSYESSYKPYIIGKTYESTFQCIKRCVILSFLEEVMIIFQLDVHIDQYGLSQYIGGNFRDKHL